MYFLKAFLLQLACAVLYIVTANYLPEIFGSWVEYPLLLFKLFLLSSYVLLLIKLFLKTEKVYGIAKTTLFLPAMLALGLEFALTMMGGFLFPGLIKDGGDSPSERMRYLIETGELIGSFIFWYAFYVFIAVNIWIGRKFLSNS